jgi:hypothetical protein
MKYRASANWATAIVCGMGLVALGSTICLSQIGGQTLPSDHYFDEGVRYFPPGPEFKLSKEAAAMKAYEADADAQSP